MYFHSLEFSYRCCIPANANLSMASILNFNMRGIPAPAANFGGTPWTDLAKEGDSYFINESIDRILPV